MCDDKVTEFRTTNFLYDRDPILSDNMMKCFDIGLFGWLVIVLYNECSHILIHEEYKSVWTISSGGDGDIGSWVCFCFFCDGSTVLDDSFVDNCDNVNEVCCCCCCNCSGMIGSGIHILLLT